MARISLDPPKTLSYRIGTRFARRRYGVMPDPGAALGHNMKVARSYALFELGVERWRTLDLGLKDLAVMAAAASKGLMTVLAPDVTLLTDGGGKARAALRPITGAAKTARFLAAIAGRPYMGVAVSDMTLEAAEINGSPGTLIMAGDRAIAALTLTVSNGRITAVQLLANPDKLAAVSAGRTLPRC